MELPSEKEQDKIIDEMEKLISDWQTYYDQSKREKPHKLLKDLK
jgi:hypothetical protein